MLRRLTSNVESMQGTMLDNVYKIIPFSRTDHVAPSFAGAAVAVLDRLQAS
jgi:hypothetical protein